MKKKLKVKIDKLNEKYEEVKEKINIEKAEGNLSKLFNLREDFDETFDQFFDDIELRAKYDDWDYENKCIKFEKSNTDLLEELDEKDLNEYIKFYENYISLLEDDLKDLKEREDF